MTLRKNQSVAVKNSILNEFESGVHFHATGTGKSWISLEILIQYNNKFNNRNVLWLCEQKSILIEQFKKEKIIENGYGIIYKKFNIINYAKDKPSKWFNVINSLGSKPVLLIINRSFLVYNKNYKNLIKSFSLIIHDECHSIKNKSTQVFYNYILDKDKSTSCIGFSATPILDFKPFQAYN